MFKLPFYYKSQVLRRKFSFTFSVFLYNYLFKVNSIVPFVRWSWSAHLSQGVNACPWSRPFPHYE